MHNVQYVLRDGYGSMINGCKDRLKAKKEAEVTKRLKNKMLPAKAGDL